MPKNAPDFQSFPPNDEKYRAPALEKGIEILELLSTSHRPMTLSQISARLDRSINELFRMVQVLEKRGYLVATGDGFELSNKLFSLAMSTGVTQNLLSRAMPLMEALSESTGQACHLVVASADQMVVVARVEAPRNMSFSVRVGFRRELIGTTSGTILYAFQRPGAREALEAMLRPTVSKAEWRAFDTKARQAVAEGYLQVKSPFTEGITDISCPIFSDRGLVAALTMPHIRTTLSANTDVSRLQTREAATKLSAILGG